MPVRMLQRTFPMFRGSLLHNQCRRKQCSVELVQRCCLSTSPKPISVADEDVCAKPFSAVPGPKGLPFLGRIFDLPIFGKEKEVDEKLIAGFANYGPIFKISIGLFSVVHICDVDEVEKLYRQEGKYPRRVTIEHWRHWRDTHGQSRGVLIE